jgi:hypothetical protein
MKANSNSEAVIKPIKKADVKPIPTINKDPV